YKTDSNTAFTIWLWLQLIALLLFVSYFFANIASIKALNVSYIYVYGAYIFIFVYAFTELMDGNKYAVFWEGIKCMLGLAFIFYTGDWFGSDAFSIFIKYGAMTYFIASFAITFSFAKKRSKTVIA
ncbi:MAG: sterol desaturase, partial [Ferruginibacter sp.]|nr:sterol desaturase [Ferruginibacter sp.]